MYIFVVKIIVDTNNKLLKLKVIINLDVTENFILEELVKRKGFS